MNLIKQVEEVMDSDQADEFIERYRNLCTEKGRVEFDEQKKRMSEKILGGVLKRDIRISPLKTRKRKLDPEIEDVNIGELFSFRIMETKTFESDWDHLDFLLYNLDRVGILDKVMKPFEAPERLLKNLLHAKLVKPALRFFKRSIMLPVVDKTTSYRWSSQVEELFNVFVRDVLKEKLQLDGGGSYKTGGTGDDDI